MTSNIHAKQKGNLHVVLILIALAIIVGVGYVFFVNFIQTKSVADMALPAKTQSLQESKILSCTRGDEAATEGIFCSPIAGIVFSVPEIFKGKLKKLENYDVYAKASSDAEAVKIGKSEAVFGVTAYDPPESGEDNSNASYRINISVEPLHSGDGLVFSIVGSYYDSKKGTMLPWGGGQSLPTVMIDGQKFFKGGLGDAGILTYEYFTTYMNKIIKIEYSGGLHTDTPGGEYIARSVDAKLSYNDGEVTSQFHEGIETLKFLR